MARRKATRCSMLGDRLGDERRVDLRLAHLDNAEVHLRGGEAREFLMQLLDVGALLADEHAGPCRVHRDAALLVWALDHDLGDAVRRCCARMCSRIFMSSCSRRPYRPRPANQRLSQVRLMPTRRPTG